MNILLVEDNDIDMHILIRAMKKAGITGDLVRARDGREALDILVRHQDGPQPDHPFLVLLDINMPGMNGHEFLDALRQTPDIADARVVVFSTSQNPRDIARAYERFASGYLVKPDNGGDLQAALSKLSDFWQTLAHPPGPPPRHAVERHP
jgi:CheY-like chemotaxis protein